MINPLKDSGQKVVLASKSPRRQYLLEEIGIPFEVRTKDTDESYPDDLKKQDIAEYLAKKKADAMVSDMADNEVIIAADTIVWVNGQILGKPANKEEAVNMLKQISNNTHNVYTGVCIKSKSKEVLFRSTTKVTFRELTNDEIELYIENYKPYDKAGAYGIQEWIGYIGIEYIEGSYYNVMGLPVQRLYSELVKFVS